MLVVKLDDGLFFPVLDLPIARDLAILFIGYSVALWVCIETAAGQSEQSSII